MNYRILLEVDNGSDTSFQVIAQVASEAPVPNLEKRLNAEVFAAVNRAVDPEPEGSEGEPAAVTLGGLRKGRPPRGILILKFDEPDTAPSGLREGEIVLSSSELSTILGYSYNMVLQQFARARRQRRTDLASLKGDERRAKEEETIEICLRGVHFCYAEDVVGRE